MSDPHPIEDALSEECLRLVRIYWSGFLLLRHEPQGQRQALKHALKPAHAPLVDALGDDRIHSAEANHGKHQTHSQLVCGGWGNRMREWLAQHAPPYRCRAARLEERREARQTTCSRHAEAPAGTGLTWLLPVSFPCLVTIFDWWGKADARQEV